MIMKKRVISPNLISSLEYQDIKEPTPKVKATKKDEKPSKNEIKEQDEMRKRENDIFKNIKEIKSECKVALLLIENSENIRSVDLKIGGIAIRSEIVKIDFLMKNLLKNSDHLICKSLSCFNKMLNDKDLIRKKNSIKIYLSTATEFLDKMGKLLDSSNSCIVRETCRVLSSKCKSLKYRFRLQTRWNDLLAKI